MAKRAGRSDYRGYEYQLLVSAWLALEFLIVSRRCESLEVEPLSEEDLAAAIAMTTAAHASTDDQAEELAPAQTADVCIGLGKAASLLHVQVKTRSTGAWTTEDFKEVLVGSDAPKAKSKDGAKNVPDGNDASKSKPGPPRRKRPLELLELNPDVAYLFITDAGLVSELVTFEVQAPHERSGAADLPPHCREGRHPDVRRALAQRLSILSRQHEPWVEAEIHRLLSAAQVPAGRQDACRVAMVEAMRSRLLGRKPPTLNRDELVAILRAHDGLPAPPGSLEAFRAPRTLPILRERLERDHALMLVGPPGVGKTILARYLEAEHRAQTPAFEIVGIDVGPTGVAARLAQPGRVYWPSVNRTLVSCT